MVSKWILDYASPTSINTSTAQAPTGYLRNIIVVIKAIADDTAISTITSKPSVSIDKCVDGLFDGGMNKVSYIKLINADVSSLSLNDEYFTILFSGFSEVEIEDKDLGAFDGVIGYEIDDEDDGIEINTCKMYNTLKDGYTIGYIFGVALSSVNWRNFQYNPTNKDVYFVGDLGIANALYDNKISAFGKDDVVGIRLVSFFIGGESFSKPYVEKEIVINLQTNNINQLSQELSYNLQDTGIVRSFNANYIQKFYVDTGLIEDFDYSVDLTTDNNFISDLDIKPVVAVWKILMQVGRKL